MTPDIPAIVDALESTGVYNTVNLLDPGTITSIAVNLAGTTDPFAYQLWLWYYASEYQVESSDLAESVLAILAECGQWWPELAKRCRSELRQLTAA